MEKLQQFYKLKNGMQIQCGAYAEVFFASEIKSEIEVALKISSICNKKRKETFKKEVKILKMLSNQPNVCNIIKSFKLSSSGKSFGVIVLEKMDMDLLEYILIRGSIPEDETKILFKEICHSVIQCHNVGVAHLDIKPDNILLRLKRRPQNNGDDDCGDVSSILVDDDQSSSSSSSPSSSLPPFCVSEVKLCDFGFAEKWNLRTSAIGLIDVNEQIGTNEYRAPELKDVKKPKKFSMIKADVYSLGIVMFSMLTGSLPTLNHSKGIPSKSSLKVAKSFLKSESAGFELLKSILQKDPSKRPSLENVILHPWFYSTE
jgi:serine/threonine protein kinase